MDLVAVMTYISLLAVVVVLTTFGSNASTSCNGRNGCNGHTNDDGHNGCDGYNCSITFHDIFGLSEKP